MYSKLIIARLPVIYALITIMSEKGEHPLMIKNESKCHTASPP